MHMSRFADAAFTLPDFQMSHDAGRGAESVSPRARCSKATSGCRRDCTALAICSARSCCSIRPAERSAARSPGGSRSGRPSCCRRRSAASSSAMKSPRALGVRASSPSGRKAADAPPRLLLAPADRVVVVEDVVTTGGSTRETMAVAEAAGARGWRRRDRRSQRAARRRAVPCARDADLPDLPARAARCARRTARDEAGIAGRRGYGSGARHTFASGHRALTLTCMRTLKLTLAYDGTRLRRLAAAGQRGVGSAADRGGAAPIDGGAADGGRRRPDGRRRARARPGGERRDAADRCRRAGARAQRAVACRRSASSTSRRSPPSFMRGSTRPQVLPYRVGTPPCRRSSAGSSGTSPSRGTSRRCATPSRPCRPARLRVVPERGIVNVTTVRNGHRARRGGARPRQRS